VRRAAAGMIALTSAALLCACGSSAHTSSGAAGGSPAGTPTTSAPLTAIQARALAATVNLRPADLPGFNASGGGEHEAQTSDQSEFARCIRPAAGLRGIAEASSKRFEREASGGLDSVQSSVTVERTRATVAELIVAARSAQARVCLAHFVTEALSRAAHGAASFSGVFVEAAVPAVRGTGGGFGWRVSATVSVRGVHFPVRFDILGFGYRSALVGLFAFGFPQPFPHAQEQSLLALLIGRAQSFSS
jgi:hypothetical protein